MIRWLYRETLRAFLDEPVHDIERLLALVGPDLTIYMQLRLIMVA
jgi:hypothetical protein